MGEPMLDALLRDDFDARGFDIAPKTHPKISSDFNVFCQELEVCIIVVRDAKQCDALLFGTQNLVAHAAALTHIVISSTLSPKYVRALRDRVPAHISLIDAPMSGAQIAARECRLSFMLGGDTKLIDPMLRAMGSSFHHMGDFGAGMQAKVLNNLLAAASTAMTRQVVDWANQSGLDEDTFLALVNASSGQNWLASGWNSIEFAKDGYRDDNSIGILSKDIDAALDSLPEDADIALPQQVQRVIRGLAPYVSEG